VALAGARSFEPWLEATERNEAVKRGLIPVIVLTLAAALAATALATAPGKNGRIAFAVRGPDASVNIYSMLPDGRELTQLTKGNGYNACPSHAHAVRRRVCGVFP
jgi:hypothetical protein